MSAKDRVFRFGPAVVLLAFAAAFLATAFDYDPGSRAMPMVVAGVTIALLLVEILGQRRTALGESLRRIFGGSLPEADAEPDAPFRREIAAVLWVLAFLVLAVLFGFYIAIPAYVLVYLTLYARKPPLVSALVALGIVGLLYVLFQVFLSYPIFSGILFGGLM